MAEGHGKATRCVHQPRSDDAYGAPRTPVYTTTTFAYSSTANLRAALDTDGPSPLYTRYGGNPTVVALERQLADLEGAEQGLAFTAGMAAISALCFAFGQHGVICLGNAYGGTLELVGKQLPGLGFHGRTLAPNEVDTLDAELAKGCGLVIMESPTNPDVRIQDIAQAASRARAAGALLAVDNTFATPINQNPLHEGADLVVHSATKFLGGHSDLTAGAVAGDASLIEPLLEWRATLGQTPSPETASLLTRSLQTLAVRMERHNANAQRLAEAMQSDERVRSITYPGLAGKDDHAAAQRQMRGFGGMLSLSLDADAERTAAVADELALFLNAPSLGGVESLVTQPLMTSHADLNPDERATRGIHANQLRLSVGIEDVTDLIADLRGALDNALGAD